jgi:lipoprotein-releasing system permease protein
VKSPLHCLPVELALRYLRGKKSERFIGFSMLTSMAGIALVMMVFVLVSSVQEGFSRQLEKSFANIPAFLVESEGTVQALSFQARNSPADVLAMTPALNGGRQGSVGIALLPSMLIYLAKTEVGAGQGTVNMMAFGGKASPVDLHCLDSGPSPVIPEGRQMKEGALPSKPWDLLVESGTAARLNLVPGGKALAAFGNLVLQPTGPALHVRRLDITGIVSKTPRDYLGKAWIPAADCLRFMSLEPESVTYAVAWEKDPGLSGEVAQKEVDRMTALLKKHLDIIDPRSSYLLRDGASLGKILKVQKWVTLLVMTFVCMLGAYQMLSGLLMMVREKRSDIAVLRSMGYPASSIRLAFLLQGFVIGLLGLCGGLGAGLLVAPRIPGILTRLATLANQDEMAKAARLIPVCVNPSLIGLAFATGLGVCLVAALYPAIRASKTPPVLAFQQGDNP